MKIGVALSGCDIGGVSAYSVLQELAAMGLDIGMVSACCVPAATSLLYAYGGDENTARNLSERFLNDTRESGLNAAVLNFTREFHFSPQDGGVPFAVNAVNVSDGKIVAFTNDNIFTTETLETLPLVDSYDALCATIGLMDGLGSYSYRDMRLCDFCCWYGCPLYPLRMAGLRKIISVSFVPKFPKTPYEALVKQIIAASSPRIGVHISIEFPDKNVALEEYTSIAVGKIKKHTNQIVFKALF